MDHPSSRLGQDKNGNLGSAQLGFRGSEHRLQTKVIYLPLELSLVYSCRADVDSMHQLVRQVRLWKLRADERRSVTSLNDCRSAPPIQSSQTGSSGASSSTATVHELIRDNETSGSEASVVEDEDVEMLDVDEVNPKPTRLSDINPESHMEDSDPIVVDNEVGTWPPTIGPAPITLTDAASVSSSVHSTAGLGVRKAKAHPDFTTTWESRLTTSTHSSWSFHRVTGFPSSTRRRPSNPSTSAVRLWWHTGTRAQTRPP